MTSQKTVIGVHYDACYERHQTGAGHPESATRYQVLRKALEALPPEVIRLPARKAKVAEVLLAHAVHYPDVVMRDALDLADVLRTGDTAIGPESYDVALEATGAVLEAVDAVMRGEVLRAFCAVRPPGHHATADRGMGFCIFNHVAVAANYLRKNHGLTRIAIIDWDVHHGNGTEAIFAADPDVFYISLHQDGIYPNTGYSDYSGTGEGTGTTLNLPLPPASDGDTALAAWSESAVPALEAFRPEFILISAGFDARESDPLGNLKWTDETFFRLTSEAVIHAEKHANGRIVSVLEGGYNPAGLASAATAHIRAMTSPTR